MAEKIKGILHADGLTWIEIKGRCFEITEGRGPVVDEMDAKYKIMSKKQKTFQIPLDKEGFVCYNNRVA